MIVKKIEVLFVLVVPWRCWLDSNSLILYQEIFTKFHKCNRCMILQNERSTVREKACQSGATHHRFVLLEYIIWGYEYEALGNPNRMKVIAIEKD